MKLLKLLFLPALIVVLLGACSGKKPANKGPDATDRINRAEQNSDHLFEEMD